ncbi:hypothetical protein NPIL_168381, partial [Nephila pilipes]
MRSRTVFCSDPEGEIVTSDCLPGVTMVI